MLRLATRKHWPLLPTKDYSAETCEGFVLIQCAIVARCRWAVSGECHESSGYVRAL